MSLSGLNIGAASGPTESGELWVLDHLHRQLPQQEKIIIFDVGANLGLYATEVLARFQNVQIFCFEPSRQTFAALSKRLAGQEKAALFNFGLGESEATVDLFLDEETSGMASVYQRQLDHLNVRMDLREQITLKTLDGFCSQKKIDHIHLLKLDVEGHELKALQGASSLINNQAADFIQFEFGGTCIDSRTFFRDFFLLLSPGYEIYRILRDGLAHIPIYDEKWEVFLLVNYLAVSKRWLASGEAGAPREVGRPI